MSRISEGTEALSSKRSICPPNAGMSKLKRYVYIILGSIFLALGMIGVFIPVLPTTPFLLLTAFFYLRSSYKLYCWLTNHKLFGSYINDYMEHRAVKKRAKAAALVFLWTTMTISIVIVPITDVKILLPLIGLAVTLHILSLKTLK